MLAGVPPVAVRPAPRTARRAEIVQVAYRLIAERGLEGLRFADIAREAGINNGTLLYYFASKDALIEAVGTFLVDQFSQSSAPRSAQAPLDPLAELRWEFVDAQDRLHDRAGVVYIELVARAQRDATVAALLQDIDAGWRGWLTSILDLDLQLVVTAIMAAIRGLGLQAQVDRAPGTVEPAMAAIAELIERWVVRETGA